MKTFLHVLLFIVPMLIACTPIPLSQATATPLLVMSTHTSRPVVLTATLRAPAATSLSILPADQAEARVVELLKTNNGCKLPCFWGITPGHTSWNEAKSFLEAFSSRTDGMNFTKRSGFLSEFYFPLKDNTPVDLHLRLIIDNNLIQEVSVMDFDAPSYHLAEFLANNGMPDQVWLLTYSQVSYGGGDVVPFPVYLFYKDAQMIVAYGYGQGIVKGDQITGCIEGSPSLYIWSLDKSLTFQEAGKLGGYYQPSDKFLEISDATQGKLNAKKFYESFKEPRVETCFQTPTKLWPGN